MVKMLFFILLIAACNGRCFSFDNIALGKPTFQSTDYLPYYSSYAVDGMNETDLFTHACTHTSRERNPWWTVDLLQMYLIYSLKVTNRGTTICGPMPCADRLSGFEVHVSNNRNIDRYEKLCYTDTNKTLPLSIDAKCSSPISGRYVTLSLPREGYLTLCEVEVYGQLEGFGTFSSSLDELSTETLLSSNVLPEDVLHSGPKSRTTTVYLDMDNTQEGLDTVLTTSPTVGLTEIANTDISLEPIETLDDSHIEPGLIHYPTTALSKSAFNIISTSAENDVSSSQNMLRQDSAFDTLTVTKSVQEATEDKLVSSTELTRIPEIVPTNDKVLWTSLNIYATNSDVNQVKSNIDISVTERSIVDIGYQDTSTAAIDPYSVITTDTPAIWSNNVHSLITKTRTPPVSVVSKDFGNSNVTQVVHHETNTTSTESRPLNTKLQNVCGCRCKYFTVSSSDLFMSNILTDLHIDKNNISRIRNRYVCSSDSRVSARVSGWISLSLFVLIFVGLILTDISKICLDFRGNTFGNDT